MAFTVAVVVICFLGLLLIGAWVSRKIKTIEHYIIAGRDLGFWVFAILVIAFCMSGMTLLGVSGLGYMAGWSTAWEQIFVPLNWAVCILISGVNILQKTETSFFIADQSG